MDCIQINRLERLETDIRELQNTDRKHNDDITELKEGQAETRAVQKMIFDQLAEIKALVTNRPEKQGQEILRELEKIKAGINTTKGSPNKEWLDTIKWIIMATLGAIVAWLVKRGGTP